MEKSSSSKMTVSTASGEASNVSSPGNQMPEDPFITHLLTKKRRNQPGTPDPEAEVIALSPKALLATNRFVCEICGKGFQRDQNLQMHRRGHNLPWKLRQRTTKEIRKRVYVCPELSCVHHDPRRALGDLTGIKKHFCRKHGEKKLKCERCSKKYAVQCDWKAHMKTCGSKEYKCDCGTVFARRDSFVTHRAFCAALAQESAKVQTQSLGVMRSSEENNLNNGGLNSPAAIVTASCSPISPSLSNQCSELPKDATGLTQPTTGTATGCSGSSFRSNGNGASGSMLAPLSGVHPYSPQSQTAFSDLIAAMTSSDRPTTFASSLTMVEPSPSLSLSSLYPFPSITTPLFPSPGHDSRHHAPPPQPAISATALLQKAAQMGTPASCASLFSGLDLRRTASSSSQRDNTAEGSTQWNNYSHGVVKPESCCGSARDGLSSDDGFGVSGPLVGGSSRILFGTKPTTLDLLGLGIGPSNASTSGLSALLSSMHHGLDVVDP
ncbi:hypothetical protein Nepgr_015723 [Nepenthes gracilis]|uniref:C2H2-type domain-containing protein n=1 Tax=Nepenthes gracilis TaxID=150966 RepID=A0AAD3SMK4_NEPGR|nr:hypothetical protein Nepgr_015723 [Nepenthes gracilis]